jgi:signal recognition particle receptor subunit beta
MSDPTARIVLWGIEGAGKSTTLQTIYTKLRPDLRGTLRREPSRLDPTVHAEILPIILGPVGGVGSAIEIVAVPGASDQVLTRKQLLDRVDGIVLVLDCSPEKIDANPQSIAELRDSLADYGRSLEEIPVVLQYNKRDIADPFAIEALHRRIGFGQSAVFETIATTGQGILPTLTTISKHVVRARRSISQPADGDSKEEATAPMVATERQAPRPTPLSRPERAAATPSTNTHSPIHANGPATHEILEAAILDEAEALTTREGPDALERAFSDSSRPPRWQHDHAAEGKPDSTLVGDLRVVSVGQADLEDDGGVRLPLVLGDVEGRTRSVVLSLRLDPLVDRDRD